MLKSILSVFSRKYSKSKMEILRNEISEMNIKMQWIIDFHRAYFDISAAAKSSGNLLLYQRAGSRILEIFDIICQKYKWRYWLEAGNLIGYIRHNGMPIPWDDDVDVYMPREDYEKAVVVLPRLFGNSHLKGIWLSMHYKFSRYKNAPCDFDIFPMDQCSERISQSREARIQLLKRRLSAEFFNRDDYLKAAGYENGNDFVADIYKGKIKNPDALKRQNEAARKKWNAVFMGGALPASDGTFVSGYEFAGMPEDGPSNMIADYDWIFPLRRGKYMDVEINIPNKSEKFANAQYGDYMGFPNNFHIHAEHSKFSPQQIEDLVELSSIDAWQFVSELDIKSAEA